MGHASFISTVTTWSVGLLLAIPYLGDDFKSSAMYLLF
jgi:hypothetical protein